MKKTRVRSPSPRPRATPIYSRPRFKDTHLTPTPRMKDKNNSEAGRPTSTQYRGGGEGGVPVVRITGQQKKYQGVIRSKAGSNVLTEWVGALAERLYGILQLGNIRVSVSTTTATPASELGPPARSSRSSN